mmetsp:Transcript_24215/g.40105  ORF Transcript_24215/g.40105 Transcript_24215/m.40105 type:complete len:204 (+) Transcript_24215:85-696(+)
MITVPLLDVRTIDMLALLLAGALLELVTKGIVMHTKAKSSKETKMEQQLFALQYETAQKRRLGPTAFVATSKLERQGLVMEKELAALVEQRKLQGGTIAKLTSRISLVFYVLVFLAYYNLSILSIDGTRVVGDDIDSIVSTEQEEHARATAFLQGFLFPISYVGMGVKVARFGLPTPGFGALLVLWSSQVTVGKIMDGVEWLL